MATLSADKKYVTVVKGDTLSEIAQAYNTTVKKLASINNISNVNLIYIGQKIYLTGVATSNGSSASTTKTANANVVTIKHDIGLQSKTDDGKDTLIVSWSWDKHNKTENYKVNWQVWDTTIGQWTNNESTTTNTYSTFSNFTADYYTKVRAVITPVSKTYTSNNKETTYFTGKSKTSSIFYIKNVPPDTPSAPKVEIDNNFKLTATLSGIDSDIKGVHFRAYRSDTGKQCGDGVALVKLGMATHTRTISAGYKYQVACRVQNKADVWSNWSEWSEPKAAPPSAPSKITTCKAVEDKDVYLEWSKVNSATGYTINYTNEERYFEGSNATTSITVDGMENNHFTITGLESGKEYFFRVNAVGENNTVSGWTDTVSIIIGEPPSAPTTWSSTTTAMVGEKVNLYWIHNSKDNSSETFANLKYVIKEPSGDGYVITTTSFPIENTAEEDEKDGIKSYTLETSALNEGAEILWQVRTAGVSKEYGEWSIQRSIEVYAPPQLQLNLTDADENDLDILTSFPFYVRGLAQPTSQAPIGYHLSVIANNSYETTDNVGNSKIVSVGDEVYSKYFDISTELLVEFSPGNIDLVDGISYTIKGSVTMDSGLTAESSIDFTVSWDEIPYIPNAEISFDSDQLVTHIHPYCESVETVFYKVDITFGETVAEYIKTDEIIDITLINDSEPLTMTDDENFLYYTTTGEQVFIGYTIDETTSEIIERFNYCTVDISTLEDVTLSVYRREFDGTFTKLATGLSNLNNTFITDPHPALDYARYRIVATSATTGAVGYYDAPPFPIQEKAIIIQWDEEWSTFEPVADAVLADPPWTGSMLRLPYNVDVSDSNSSDVSLIEYAGRKHPVSYYGTQLGETSSWSVSIDKTDVETLYALRRLRIWMGDVYVREPSGSGYWATIKVSFSQKHCEVTIPVTLDITRVEGGM